MGFRRPFFSPQIGVDLGTATTRICMAGHGVVVREPSVVLERSGRRDDIIVAGACAHETLGRVGSIGAALCPVQGGAVTNFLAAEDMLRSLLMKVVQRWDAPSLILSVPIGATLAERRALQELAEAVGARAAHLVDAPIAAALGAALPISDAVGSMIIDVGAGKTEAAVLNLGRVVYSRSTRIGGEALDHAIVNWFRDFRGVVIGNSTAEAVKLNAAYAKHAGDELIAVQFRTVARGIQLSSGLPVEICVDGSDIAGAITSKIESIVAIVINVLENIPIDIFCDIAERGIMMTGAAAALPGLQRRIADHVGIPTIVIDGHDDAVAFGLNCIINDVSRFRPMLQSMY